MRKNNKQLYESIMKDVSRTVYKHLNEGSPVSLAKNYVFTYAKKCNFNFDDMEKYLDSDALSNFMDKYKLSTMDSHKFMDTMKKIAYDKNTFDSFINRMKKQKENEEKVRSKWEEELKTKTNNKIDIVKNIIKPLIDNNVSIIIDGKKKNIKVNNNGDIECYS